MLLLIALAHAPLYLTAADGGVIGPTASGSGADAVVRALNIALIDSRSYPLFAALLGYGLVLSTRRLPDARAARRLVRRRGFWLILFGLGMALLVTPVEILGAYGVITLLIAGVFGRADKIVQRVIIALIPLMILTSFLLGVGMAAGGEAGPPLAATGYDLEGLIIRIVGWLFAVFSNVLFYPVALSVLVGVLAARKRVLEEPERHQVLLLGVAGGGIAVAVIGALPLLGVTTGVLDDAQLWWATGVHTITGLGAGFGYLAVFGLIGPAIGRHVRVTRFLSALGRRSLTGYVLMEAGVVAILSPVFLGAGVGAGYVTAALAAVAAWLIAVVVAVVLELAGRPGPLDAAMRRLVRRAAPVARSRDP